jgi:hypothetical protein
MRRVLVGALVCALLMPASSAFAAAGAGSASIAGAARSAAGKVTANTTVQLRDVATGQLAGTTTSNAAGAFSFTGLEAGNYVVEVVNAAGQIIGTSASIAVAAGAVVTGVGVSAAAAAAAAGGAGAFFGSTLGIVTLAAAGAGVAGVTVASRTPASPSR